MYKRPITFFQRRHSTLHAQLLFTDVRFLMGATHVNVTVRILFASLIY